MRTSLKVGVVAAFAFLATSGAQATLNLPTMQCSYSFATQMGLGARGQQAMDLQKVLNMYPETRVATVGAGSPGMETMLFGPATRAAVRKFQGINNIPTTGFVGPLTLASLNKVCTGTGTGTGSTGSNLPAGCTSTTGFSPLTGQSCSAGTGTTVSGSGLQVMAGTNNGGTIIGGSAQVPVLNFRVMNTSAGEVTVNSLKFMKLGTVSDASIVNGYLSSGNQIVGQFTSLSQGVMTFNNINARIPAGATVDMTLRVDTSSSISAGNLIGFQLMSANDVTISAGTVGGTFPLVGGNFYTTTVSNPSLSAVGSVAYQTVGSSVDAGTTNFRAGAVTFNVQNNPVRLQSVRFNVNGSINPASDLANVRLTINGTQVATGAVSGNSVFFDLGSNSVVLPTGSQLMEVYADVLGTPNRSFRMEILRPYDVMLMDTQYNTNISFSTPSSQATQVEVRQGTATMSVASDTPTGTIALGGSNVTLAKFRVFAAGEALRIRFLPFTIVKTGGSSWDNGGADSQIRNISLIGDDGVQVGTTINTPSGCSFGAVDNVNDYSCSFGSASANVNYTIPANTTRVLSLRADIQNTANFSTIQARINQESANVEGQISFQTTGLPGATGSILRLTTTPFQVALNSSVSTQTVVAGTNNQKIGSFQLSASSAEGIRVTGLSIRTNPETSSTIQAPANPRFRVQNLTVKVGDTTIGNVVSTVSGNTTTTFSPSSAIVIPAGGSVIVDVFANVLTDALATGYAPVQFVTATGNGVVTNANQTLTGGPITGQLVNIVGSGSATANSVSGVPVQQQLVFGSNDVTLGQYSFTASNNEDIRLDEVMVRLVATTTSPAPFNNLRLIDVSNNGSTVLATLGSLTQVNSTTYTGTFKVASTLVIPKNQTRTVAVRANVSQYDVATGASGVGFRMSIENPSTDVVAFGQASNALITITPGTALTSNQQQVVRTRVSPTFTAISSGIRTRTPGDNIATLRLDVDRAFGVDLKQLRLTTSGAAINPASSTLIELVDADSQQVVASYTGTLTNGGVVTLTPTGGLFNITAGESKTFRVRVDASAFLGSGNTGTEGFSLQIAGVNDLVYSAAGETTNINLNQTMVPLIATVSYE